MLPGRTVDTSMPVVSANLQASRSAKVFERE